MTARPIDTERTLGELAAERPRLLDALERLQLEYCCGGDRSFADACRARGLDPETTAVVLAELEGDAPPRAELHDLRGATVSELCDHIVAAHHDPLRRELTRIRELLATVVRVHGAEHPELHDLERLFAGLSRELLQHLDNEEASLFPAARGAGGGGEPAENIVALVAEHAAEHDATGDALAALRELAGGYAVERAYCSTHRRLLEGFDAFEHDLHRHVHEENNLLFPRLLEAVAG